MKNIKREFFKEMKNKSFYKRYKNVLFGESPNDVVLAVCLSSLITHSLIELSHKSEIIYDIMDIKLQTNLLNQFISGEISSEEIVEEHKKLFKRYLI